MEVVWHVLDSFKWFTVYEWVLCSIDVLILIWYAFPIRVYFRWLDFVPVTGVAVAVASVCSGDITIPAILLYAFTGVLFACTATKLWKPISHIPVPRYRFVRILLCGAGVVPIVLALLVAGELRYNPESDYSELGYSQAFVQLNERLSREYPFEDWKKVNWQERKAKYEPIFKQAEQAKNKALYYKTLREYVHSLRDGHSKIVNEDLYSDNPVFHAEAGGGYGISTIMLDNGTIRVDLLIHGSPAENSGIQLGAEIVRWDGKAAKEAYERTVWSENPTATEGDRRVNQGRFMVRAPIGKEVEVEYRNIGDSHIKTTTLTAYDDKYESLKKTRVKLNREDPPLEAKQLPNGYGYVKIRYFLPSQSMPDPVKTLEEILIEFQEQKVKGIIIDVRDNPGGSDDMVADSSGFFVQEEKLYENVSYYNRNTGTFELNDLESRTIKPAANTYNGNVAILINHRTTSSGEGLPIALKGLPHVKVVGFTSTNGSFGVVTRPIRVAMPEGYILEFPDGRSLGVNNVIQGDSNDHGQGGGIPDVKVPLNEQTFYEKVVEGKDVELDYAVQALERMK
ncbi:S41 family peptidase [Brevibacillus fluminis]|nr:S41 family peptidase [Brevibacillus fluminis]